MAHYRVLVHFAGFMLDRQGVATDDGNYLQATLYLALQEGDHVWSDLSCLVRQSAGSPGSADEGELEVTLPAGYDGPMNHELFRDGCSAYYREAIGAEGTIIGLGGGTGGIAMSNIAIEHARMFVMEWDDPS
jgi:hypothetical protein